LPTQFAKFNTLKFDLALLHGGGEEGRGEEVRFYCFPRHEPGRAELLLGLAARFGPKVFEAGCRPADLPIQGSTRELFRGILSLTPLPSLRLGAREVCYSTGVIIFYKAAKLPVRQEQVHEDAAQARIELL
jgi:hypothetical protein